MREIILTTVVPDFLDQVTLLWRERNNAVD